MRFVTDPKQAREVSMKDGSVYRVSPSGVFSITDARHLDEMAHGNHDCYSNAVTFRGSGWNCLCSHACWAWQRACPSCGQPQPA